MAKLALAGRWLFILSLVAGLALLTPFTTLAGQGGTTTQTDNNSGILIIIGLVVILVLAGLGLILSRRKK